VARALPDGVELSRTNVSAYMSQHTSEQLHINVIIQLRRK